MRVYVTGGSGFLGRQVVSAARAAGHDVLAPRRAECDLSMLDSVIPWLSQAKIECIVHAAAYYGGLNMLLAEPATILSRNVSMVNNLFEAAARSGVRKLVSIGSSCAFPGALEGEMSEELFWAGPMHPSVAAYGISKKLQSVAQAAYHSEHGLEGLHLIPNGLYGPHDTFSEYRGHVVSVMIKRFVEAERVGAPTLTHWGDGSAVREFLYVEDCALAIARAIDAPHDLVPINIGTGVGTSIRELSELIRDLSGYRGDVIWDPTKPNGAPRKVLASSRVRALVPDFQPRPLRDGLTQTVEWYRNNKAAADARA